MRVSVYGGRINNISWQRVIAIQLHLIKFLIVHAIINELITGGWVRMKRQQNLWCLKNSGLAVPFFNSGIPGHFGAINFAGVAPP